MLWLLIGIGLILFGIVIGKIKDDDDCFSCAFPLGFGAVLVTLCIVMFLANSWVILHKNEQLQEYNEDIQVLIDRRDEQVQLISVYCKDYPLEKGIYENFNPQILLKLPEIKSDTFLIAQLNSVASLSTDVANTRMQLNGIRRSLRWYSHRWIIPSFVKPIVD